MMPLLQPPGAVSSVLFQPALMVLLLFLQQYPQPIPQVLSAWNISFYYGSSLFLMQILFLVIFCNKLGQIEWLKTKLLFAQDPTWAGFPSDLTWNHPCNHKHMESQLGWPPKKSGVVQTRWNTAVYCLSPSRLSAEKLDLFYLVSQGSKRPREQKHPGLSEP